MKEVDDPAASDEQEEMGIPCPKCACTHHRTLETRKGVKRVARVRICRHCGKIFTTNERLPRDEEGPSQRDA